MQFISLMTELSKLVFLNPIIRTIILKRSYKYYTDCNSLAILFICMRKTLQTVSWMQITILEIGIRVIAVEWVTNCAYYRIYALQQQLSTTLRPP